MKKAFVLAIAMLLAISGVANAAGRSSIILDQSNPTFGDHVTFTWNGDKAQSIQLHCFYPVNSDRLVFASSRMLYEGGVGYNEPFVLGPSAAWTSGEATCKAMLGYRSQSGNYRILASTTFYVGP